MANKEKINNLDQYLIEYYNLYLKEFTYNETLYLNMVEIINLNTKLSLIDQEINQIFSKLSLECESSNVSKYIVVKIILKILQTLEKMSELIVSNNTDVDMKGKIDYLVKRVDYNMDKIFSQIKNMPEIISSDGNLIKENFGNLKKFIEANKNSFSSSQKIDILEKIIN